MFTTCAYITPHSSTFFSNQYSLPLTKKLLESLQWSCEEIYPKSWTLNVNVVISPWAMKVGPFWGLEHCLHRYLWHSRDLVFNPLNLTAKGHFSCRFQITEQCPLTLNIMPKAFMYNKFHVERLCFSIRTLCTPSLSQLLWH